MRSEVVCFSICVCLSVSVIKKTGGSTINTTNALYRHLLMDYVPEIRPCLTCSEPLSIGVSLHITSLNRINEIDGELNTVGYLRIIWFDERLKWDPRSTGVSSLMFPSKKVWIPTVMLGNPSRVVSNLNADDALVRVLYNGTVIWQPGDVFQSKCAYDVRNYPFDHQECHVTFVAWPYTANEIQLYSTENKVNTPFYQENGEWKLGETSSLAFAKNGLSLVQYSLTFIRRSEFFVVNVILPIIFLSILDCLAFVIPIQSGERISYTITILLSFAVFMTLVSDNIPKTSAPMSLLCYYLTSLFIGSVMVMISVTISMRLFYMDSSLPVYPACKWLAIVLNCSKNSTIISPNHVLNNPLQEGVANDVTCRQELDKDVPRVSWRDFALAFDRVCFVFYVLYFVCITIIIITYTKKEVN